MGGFAPTLGTALAGQFASVSSFFIMGSTSTHDGGALQVRELKVREVT